MNNHKGRITGIIQDDENPIYFVLEDFHITFMNNTLKHVARKIVPKDGFIHGKTFDKHTIAIKCGSKSIDFVEYVPFNAVSYVEKCNYKPDYKIEEFDSIVFRGGTLNSLLVHNAIVENREQTVYGERFVYDVNDDNIEFNFNYKNENCTVKIYSIYQFGGSAYGQYINNNDVAIKITCPKKHPLIDVYSFRSKVLDVMSILTYRKNVGFDSIDVYNSDEDDVAAHVYVNEEYEYTTKQIQTNIKFSDIKDCFLSALFETVFNSDEKDTKYLFEFIPQDDNKARFINYNMIRCAASSLELEHKLLNKKDVEDGKEKTLIPQNDEQLKLLIDQIKSLVEESKKSEKPLSEKTYSYINGNISNWSYPFAEKISNLIERHKEAFSELYQLDVSTVNDNVESFKRFRNKITHGGINVFDENVVKTTQAMIGLVYCCFLERVGLDEDKIVKLCKQVIKRNV
ncbi:MAG: hypothetical protein IJ872_03945 [Eubacterium sp.]|nr:hypothetical protein [Eubacterium sp.]